MKTDGLMGIAVVRETPNAALEWQASSLGWRSRELMAACPLKGLVRSEQDESASFLLQFSELAPKMDLSSLDHQRCIALMRFH